MKQVKCPYCGHIQEATYDKLSTHTEDIGMAAFKKFFNAKFVPICDCKKCGEGFKEEENKVEEAK